MNCSAPQSCCSAVTPTWTARAHHLSTVVGQNPPAGSSVAEGTAVSVLVAARQQVVVPQVLGLRADRAVVALTELGLAVPTPRDQTSDALPGLVISCDPPPGTSVPLGTEVRLVRAVRRRVAVPDIRGRSITAARVLLEAAGFALAPPPFQTVQSGSTAGGVVEQDPAAGTVAPLGRRVRVVLATPWNTAVPDLTGLGLEEAAAKLQAAGAPLLSSLGLPADPPGLAIGGMTHRPALAGEQAGTIVEQDPAAGTAAQLYATVAVVVATPSTMPVPDLVGLDQGAAAAALAQAGLALGAVSRRMSDKPTGLIVDQDPDAGRTWPPGGRVAVTISSPVLVDVPALLAMEQAAANEALAARGLIMGAVTNEVAIDGARPGAVIRQSPLPGQRAPRGSAVTVVVAAGVPNLVGLTSGVAAGILQALGLAQPTIIEKPSELTPDVVVAQDPAAGAPATLGLVLQLTVAVPMTVPVPDVIGRPLPKATAEMAAVGLLLSVAGSESNANIENGAVLRLDPPRGSLVQRGSIVTAVLSLGPRVRVPVPSLKGLSAEQARAQCEQADLRFDVRDKVPTTGVPAGTVVSQTPEAGTEVNLGSRVLVDLATVDPGALVPDVRNRPFDQAERILRDSRLVAANTGSSLSTSLPGGSVISQDPLPGQRVPAGTAVGLIVAVAAVEVPRLVGRSEDAAIELLTGAGLRVGAITRRLQGIEDRVIAQNPSPGTVVALRSAVALTVSLGRLRPPDRPFNPFSDLEPPLVFDRTRRREP